MKKAELSLGEADSQHWNPLGLSIKKYKYLKMQILVEQRSKNIKTLFFMFSGHKKKI